MGSVVLLVFPPLLLKCSLSLKFRGSIVNVFVVPLYSMVSILFHFDQLWTFVMVPLYTKINFITEGENYTYLSI